MAKEQNLFPLKMLVFSMGALLIGGTIVLIAGMASRSGGFCANESQFSIPAGEKPERLEFIGENIGMVTSSKEGWKIRTLDGCTGKEIRVLTVRPAEK